MLFVELVALNPVLKGASRISAETVVIRLSTMIDMTKVTLATAKAARRKGCECLTLLVGDE